MRLCGGALIPIYRSREGKRHQRSSSPGADQEPEFVLNRPLCSQRGVVWKHQVLYFYSLSFCTQHTQHYDDHEHAWVHRKPFRGPRGQVATTLDDTVEGPGGLLRRRRTGESSQVVPISHREQCFRSPQNRFLQRRHIAIDRKPSRDRDGRNTNQGHPAVLDRLVGGGTSPGISHQHQK